MKHEIFYLVWNPQAGTPTYRHETEDSAISEAKRLAAKNPGQEFFVMASIGRATKIDVAYDKFTPTTLEDELPF